MPAAKSCQPPGRRARALVLPAAAVVVVGCASPGAAIGAPAEAMIQLDPFAQATSGFPGCAATPPPLLTLAQSRIVAHERVERGTRCAMEGTCEPGGAYRRDDEINERVRAAIAAAPEFADTSLWLTTTRRWVTVSGCVRTESQRRSLQAFVKARPDVLRVFDETRVGTRGAKAK
jgi:hypothetical protein